MVCGGATLTARAGLTCSLMCAAVQAEGGLQSFNNWFTDVKAAFAAFQAAHNGDGPVPCWVYDCYKAAGADTDELDGLTDVEAYDLLKKYLPGGIKVSVHAPSGAVHLSVGGWLVQQVGVLWQRRTAML